MIFGGDKNKKISFGSGYIFNWQPLFLQKIKLFQKMKKQLIKVSLFLLVVSGVFVACKDDADTTAPVITLNGANPQSLEMLTAYAESGATANDDQDGNITSSIVIDATEIDNKLPASYEVHYNVSDAAGNATDVHRIVTVIATANALAKSYNVKDTCGTGVAAIPFAYPQSMTVVNPTRILFNKFADYSGNTTVYANINSDGTITIPSQSVLDIGSLTEDHTFQGTGYVTETGIYLEYTDRNDSSVPVSTAVCRAHFTRL